MKQHFVSVVAVLAVCACRGKSAPSQSTPAQRPSGEWTSTVHVDGRPEVTVSLGAASVSLRGERKGVQEWTSMALEHPTWNGTTLRFETTPPDDNGKLEWTFLPTNAHSARLTAVPADATSPDEVAQWVMVSP